MGKPRVRVKNILGDDVYGLWHVNKILLQKGRRRYTLVPRSEGFRSKQEAEYYAYLRTRRFIEHQLERAHHHTVQWRDVLKYVCVAACVSVMTGVAVWWRDQPKNSDYRQNEGLADLFKRTG